MTTSTQMTFDEMRDLIRESDRGKVMDSLIAVEIGLDHYEAWWDAHTAIRDEVAPEDDDEGEILLAFLLDMGEIIDFGTVDFDKIMATPK